MPDRKRQTLFYN